MGHSRNLYGICLSSKNDLGFLQKVYEYFTWNISNSATVAEYNGYCGMGIITPGRLPSTGAFSNFKTFCTKYSWIRAKTIDLTSGLGREIPLWRSRLPLTKLYLRNWTVFHLASRYKPQRVFE